MIDSIKNFARWIREILLWFLNPKMLYFISVLLLPGLYGHVITSITLNAKLELQIRFAGFLFQISGIGIVALGLHDARKLFELPSFSQITKKWWNCRPKLTHQPKHLSVTVNMAAKSSMTAFSTAILSIKGATIEERVSTLEKELAEHLKNYSETQKQNEERNRSLAKELTSEQRERLLADQRVENKLKEFSVGGIHLEFLSVFLLLFGAIFSTFSNEIAKLFK